MKPVWLASTLALLVGGCLPGAGPAIDYIIPAREQAAAALASGKTARTVWQAPGGARSSDFIYETGDGILIVGRTNFMPGGSAPKFGEIAAHDAATGALLWQAPRPSIDLLLSTDVIAENPAFVFMHTGKWLAFEARDRRTGEKIWSLKLKKGVPAGVFRQAGILVAGGRNATAYSLTTGEKQWSRKFGGNGDQAAPPRLVERAGGLYALGNGVVRVDPESGVPLWEAKPPALGAVRALQSDGRLAVAYGDSGYSLLDPATGAVLASEATNRRVGFAVLAADRVLIGTGDDREDEKGWQSNWTGGRLIALDRKTGGPVWRFDLPHPIASTLLLDEGRVAFATRFRFMALDVRSGKTRFARPLPLALLKAPDNPLVMFRKWNELHRLARIGNYIVMIRDEKETVVARAKDGKLLRIYRSPGIREIGGFDSSAIADIAALNVLELNYAVEATAGWNDGGASSSAMIPGIGADNSFSRRMAAKADRVRANPNSTGQERRTAIDGAAVASQMDKQWARVEANIAVVNAGMVLGDMLTEILVARNFEKIGASLGFERKSAQNLYLRAVRDGLLVEWVERDGLHGLEFADLARNQRAFVAVSPKLDRDLDGGHWPIEFSRDGRKLYTFGLGFDPSFMEPALRGVTVYGVNEDLPAPSVLALGFEGIRFTPIGKDAWDELPVGAGPSDWEPGNACADILPRRVMILAALYGDMRPRQKCSEARYSTKDFTLPPRFFPVGSTYLMAAAFRGDDVAIDSLIGSGFDPALRNMAGLNAADYARLGGDTKLAKKLDRLAGS